MRKTLAIAALLTVMFGTVASAADDWQHQLGLYGWFAGLDGTLGIGDKVETPVSATFDDLAGFVEFAMAGHYEARGPKTVFLVDISYTGLGNEQQGEVLNQPVNVKMDLDQWIIELGGGLRISPKFEFLLAGRYYIIDTGLTMSSAADEESNSVGAEWFDIFMGCRYQTTFGTKWFASIRGDVGVGGSDFAWFGQVELGYKFSEHWGAAAAWRALGLDYTGDEGSEYFKYDVTQSGPALGLGYKF